MNGFMEAIKDFIELPQVSYAIDAIVKMLLAVLFSGVIGYETAFAERYDSGAKEVGFEKESFDLLHTRSPLFVMSLLYWLFPVLQQGRGKVYGLFNFLISEKRLAGGGFVVYNQAVKIRAKARNMEE